MGAAGPTPSGDQSGGGGGGGGYRGGDYGRPPAQDAKGGGGGGGGSNYGQTVMNASGQTPGNANDPLRLAGYYGEAGPSGFAGEGGVVIIRYPIS